MHPSGSRFSSCLEIWPGSIVRGYFERAANLIDNLHGLEIALSHVVPSQHVQCCHRQPPRRDGQAWSRCEGRVFETEITKEPWLIYLSPDGMQPLFSALHEFGHLVHYAARKAAEERGGEAATRLAVCMGWLASSNTTLRLARLSEQAEEIELEMLIRALMIGEPPMRLSMPLQAYLDYLISEPELFARGYAQWVESWERDALITDQLNYWLAPVRQRVPEQWARNEFVDGIAVFNALFLELGWMKT